MAEGDWKQEKTSDGKTYSVNRETGERIEMGFRHEYGPREAILTDQFGNVKASGEVKGESINLKDSSGNSVGSIGLESDGFRDIPTLRDSSGAVQGTLKDSSMRSSLYGTYDGDWSGGTEAARRQPSTARRRRPVSWDFDISRLTVLKTPLLFGVALITVFLLGKFLLSIFRPSDAERLATLQDRYAFVVRSVKSDRPAYGAYSILDMASDFIQLKDYSTATRAFSDFASFDRSLYRDSQERRRKSWQDLAARMRARGEQVPNIIWRPMEDELESFARDQKIATELSRLCGRVAADPTSKDAHLALGRKLEFYGYKEAAQSEKAFGTDN